MSRSSMKDMESRFRIIVMDIVRHENMATAWTTNPHLIIPFVGRSNASKDWKNRTIAIPRTADRVDKVSAYRWTRGSAYRKVSRQ